MHGQQIAPSGCFASSAAEREVIKAARHMLDFRFDSLLQLPGPQAMDLAVHAVSPVTLQTDVQCRAQQTHPTPPHFILNGASSPSCPFLPFDLPSWSCCAVPLSDSHCWRCPQ